MPEARKPDTRLVVALTDEARCRITQLPSKQVIDTATPAVYGGPGDGFSSTDLVAAALGSCIASSVEPVASRHRVDRDRITVEVAKTLSRSPRRIRRLDVTVRVDGALKPMVVKRLQRAAGTCAVKASLHPGVDVRLAWRGSHMEICPGDE